MSIEKYEEYGPLIKRIKESIQKDNFGQTIIIEGSSAVDKLSLTLEIIKGEICHNEKGSSCDKCIACKKVDKGNYEDLLIIESDSKRKTKGYSVSQLREEVIPFLQRKPISKEGISVLIIPEADSMNEASQDTLLKILEEPKENRQIFLLCENSEKLQVTVRSRSSIYRINYMDIDLENSMIEESKTFLNMIYKKEDFFTVKNFLEENIKSKEDLVLIIDAMELNLREILIKGGNQFFSLNRLIDIINILEETKDILRYNISYKYAMKNLFLTLTYYDDKGNI